MSFNILITIGIFSFFTLIVISQYYESKLISAFNTNIDNLNIGEKVCRAEFTLKLMNLDWLPSYRGYAIPVNFSKDFECAVYDKFVILDIKPICSVERKCKYIPLRNFKIKRDLIVGQYITCKVDNIKLNFRLEKEHLHYFKYYVARV